MLFDIICWFFIMAFGVTIINVGLWVNRTLNRLEYDKYTRKGILITTCILGIIGYIIKISHLFSQ